jgi:Zn finger protein HypA/HybF involved in hydrogenase expression
MSSGGMKMGEITDIWTNKPHIVSEVVCLKCLKRWMAVRSEETLLKDLECPKCGEIGFAIETGEVINDS